MISNKKIILSLLAVTLIGCGGKKIDVTDSNGDETVVEIDGTVDENSQSNADKEDDVQGLKLTDAQNAKINDFFDHLVAEDWEYIYNHMEHEENEISSPDDLEYLLKSALSMSMFDRDEPDTWKIGMKDRKLNVDNIEREKDENTNYLFFNIYDNLPEEPIRFLDVKLIDGKTKQPDDYVAVIHDFVKEVTIFVPGDAQNIKVRDVEISDDFIDNEAVPTTVLGEELNHIYEKDKAYVIKIPFVTAMRWDEEIYEKSKEYPNLDFGHPKPLIVIADSNMGKIESEINEDNIWSGLLKFKITDESVKEEICNSITDSLQKMMSLRDKNASLEEYKTLFSNSTDESYIEKYIQEDFIEKLKGDTIENSKFKTGYKKDSDFIITKDNTVSFTVAQMTKWDQNFGVDSWSHYGHSSYYENFKMCFEEGEWKFCENDNTYFFKMIFNHITEEKELEPEMNF